MRNQVHLLQKLGYALIGLSVERGNGAGGAIVAAADIEISYCTKVVVLEQDETESSGGIRIIRFVRR
jgi:hypothetical protein